MLDDGTYEAIVVDAEDGSAPGSVALELAIAAGEHRGEVVAVTASGLHRDPIELLAVPGTLVVDQGQPTFTAEG